MKPAISAAQTQVNAVKVGQGCLGKVSLASSLRSNVKLATRATEALTLRLSAERKAPAAAVNTTVTTTKLFIWFAQFTGPGSS